MSAFRYTAIDSAGAGKKGLLDADSERAARAKLREAGLIPLTLEPAASAPKTARSRQLSQSQLIDFTRQFSSLVAAGLPLERALANLALEMERGNSKALLEALRAGVAGGQPLAATLSDYPEDFPEIYRAMIAAGEASGSMAAVLQRLAAWLEARKLLRARLTQACIYPAIVVAVAVLVVGALLTFVVPQVVGVFASARQKLPPLTVMTLALSNFLRGWWLPISSLLIAAAISTWWALRQPMLRRGFDQWLLGMPLIGPLVRDTNAARFGATLGALVGAGVPILKALQGAAQTLGNRAMRTDAERAQVAVTQGGSVARALGESGRFPPSLITFISLGEQTGQLPHMLAQVALQLREQVQRRSLQWATLLEPLLILLMGGMVMLIVLSVMLPILQLNQMVR